MLVKPIVINNCETGGIRSHLTVWMAETLEEHNKGLKGVDQLPEGINGMMFDFGDAAPRMMAMSGCLMPLNFAFINPFGQIRQLNERVNPNSKSFVGTRIDCRWVLELDNESAMQSQAAINDTITITE